MLYIIDSADTSFIKEMMDKYEILGITTNPTIIAKENKEYIPLLQELDTLLIGKDLHVQLVDETYEGMIAEAHKLRKIINTNLHIKIPVSDAGFKAIRRLSKDGFSITATAICTVNQGIMAALNGADYLAVYVNRISNSGLDGNSVIKDIKDALVKYDLEAKIVGASYKSVHQVTDSIRNGVDQVTVGKDLFEKLFYSDITDKSIKQFTIDFNDQNKEKDVLIKRIIIR